MARTLSRLAPLAALLAGCAVYDPPPSAEIQGKVDGSLLDPTTPILLRFSEPFDPETLTVKIANDDIDVEGNLPDEVDPPRELITLFTHSPGHLDDLGSSRLLPDGLTFEISPKPALKIGPRFVLILEEGLADREGNATGARGRERFNYTFDLACEAPSTAMPTGKFFMLVDVKKPIATQVQLLVEMEVDPATGALRGQFTNADRNKSLVCPTPCDAADVCRTLPSPECVQPSERAGTPDEFPDFVPNDVPPNGFSFSATGCVVDQPDGSAAFVIAPVDVIVQQPPVTLRNARMTAAFARDAQGVLRGSGTLSSDDVLINGNSSGKGEGGLAARSMTDEEAPPGIPKPASEP